MSTIIRSKLGAAICCILGSAAQGGLSTSAQATDESPPSKTVKYADLNIQTPEGAKVLYQRIRAAAAEVCDVSVDPDPVFREGTRKCVTTAIDDAVKKVNAPYLTALRFGGDVSGARLARK